MLSTMLASEDSEASPQAVAVARLSMKQEFDGLVRFPSLFFHWPSSYPH